MFESDDNSSQTVDPESEHGEGRVETSGSRLDMWGYIPSIASQHEHGMTMESWTLRDRLQGDHR